MEKHLLGVPPIKREGQTISNDCFEACQGIYMREKIERLREALKEISEMQEYDSYHYKEVARKALGEKE